MSRNSKYEYERDHRHAKIVVCFIVIGLLLVDSRFSATEIAAIIIWFFGVNPVQWIIEQIRHHRHKVKWW